MARYRKKGQVDVYEKEKPGCFATIGGLIVLLFILWVVVQIIE